MQNTSELKRTLASIDGRGYASYKKITGTYDLGDFSLSIDRAQVDPFAPPSLMRIIVDRDVADLPADLLSDRHGRVAAADFLAREFADQIDAQAPRASGTGNTGVVTIGRIGQQVLERTHVIITDEQIEARIAVGLPASGRKVRGHQAAQLLTDLLPRIADEALLHRNLNAEALREHVTLYRDQEYLRGELSARQLVAFIGAGAILPRRSGDSDLPLENNPIPFISPESLRVEFELPSGRHVEGMGVPEGITVIIGGGYHGKSTLLRAIERGVYPHIAGDGREWVITRPEAASIRAEDGRAVAGVDISPFISGLPSGANTQRFSSTNASGSTSQAANLVEAVEAGASSLLIDEDTSATNFMIRDDRMRRLIPAAREPITPFVDRIRPLYAERGVSTVLVAGGSGAFFDVADYVIALDSYVPQDVTDQAREIAETAGSVPDQQAGAEQAGSGQVQSQQGSSFFAQAANRVPNPNSLQPRAKTKPAKARGIAAIQYGKETIDVAAVAQLVDPAQTEATAHALDRLAQAADGRRSLSSLVQDLDERVEEDGLDVLSPHRGHPGHLARPRPLELHAALNRYRGLTLS